MTLPFDLDRVPRVSVSNWAIVAAAALAAKLVLKGNFAAVAIGGAVLVLYVLPNTPCCDGCMAGQQCADSVDQEVASTVAALGGST